MLTEHVRNRQAIIDALRRELVGPDPRGEDISCAGALRFDTHQKADGPYIQSETGEEILTRDWPSSRYGAGVLFPRSAAVEDEDTEEAPADGASDGDSLAPDSEVSDRAVDVLTEEGEKSLSEALKDAESVVIEPGSEELGVSGANAMRPSSLGVSFLAVCPKGAEVVVEAGGGRYVKKTVRVGVAGERDWHLRVPVSISARFPVDEVTEDGPTTLHSSSCEIEGNGELDVGIVAVSRSVGDDNCQLITVCLVNRSERPGEVQCLFQSRLKVWIEAPDREAHILPYPSVGSEAGSREEATFDMLFRNCRTFAIGHGCAADWSAEGPSVARWVAADPMPVFETPSTTPDVKTDDGRELRVSMYKLAGLNPGDDGFGELEQLVASYGRWIENRESEAQGLEDAYQKAARDGVAECRRALSRMEAGLAFLKSDDAARTAFRLANHAMLLQQNRSRVRTRMASFDVAVTQPKFSTPPPEGMEEPSDGAGCWRAFQIAFILTSLQSAADPKHADRANVELIWFPTGGGKTEAYLGLASYAMFYRRLLNPMDSGTHVLMRYTLRLLTTQQFQRASSLLCAMEHLRSLNKELLGASEFSIGIWLGSSVTPNTGVDAQYGLKDMNKDVESAPNRFVLSACPWCGASLGPYENHKKLPRAIGAFPGYVSEGASVALVCSDPKCEFTSGLPVYVVDDDVYRRRPTMVIATIDKFAMLAWRPAARALFGIDETGRRVCSPPGLIIQDELHLIAGPLGSMSGLYEALIDDLCTDHTCDPPSMPKIVCSTATIRRYEEQIRALYARQSVQLFPPPGLEIGDSFFGRHATAEDGMASPGKVYLGVFAPGLGSAMTVNVRVFSSLLQSPMSLASPEEQDPWWTLMLFHLSFRELGSNLTLFQSDIPEYLAAIRKRRAADWSTVRRLSNLRLLELTSRRGSDELPKAIEALKVPRSSDGPHALDACLASSMIEVGIDIDRLSIMCVNGQPKTMSQYVQATGRIGRRWWEHPGLVVTLYSFTKPRDRSHYERFRTGHERLYADVESTSVTPFSAAVLDRALHAVMVAHVRQSGPMGGSAQSPTPCPEELLEDLRCKLNDRLSVVDPSESANLNAVFDRRLAEWRGWQKAEYDSTQSDGDVPLLLRPGAYVDESERDRTWLTPMSMRNVDAECRVSITDHFADGAEENGARKR